MLRTEMIGRPKYPNQQLRSVHVDVFFPGELRAFSVFGEIQKRLADLLPNLFVPNLRDGDPAALKPFQLRSKTQDRSLSLAVNSIGYTSFAYPGYEAFSGEALPIIKAAVADIAPACLNRVGYRYENEIGLGRSPGGHLPIEALFPGLMPRWAAEDPRSFATSVEAAWEKDGEHGVRGFNARVETRGVNEVFVVSIYAVIDVKSVDLLNGAVAIAHEGAADLFESVISDAFRQMLKGDGEEDPE